MIPSLFYQAPPAAGHDLPLELMIQFSPAKWPLHFPVLFHGMQWAVLPQEERLLILLNFGFECTRFNHLHYTKDNAVVRIDSLVALHIHLYTNALHLQFGSLGSDLTKMYLKKWYCCLVVLVRLMFTMAFSNGCFSCLYLSSLMFTKSPQRNNSLWALLVKNKSRVLTLD